MPVLFVLPKAETEGGEMIYNIFYYSCFGGFSINVSQFGGLGWIQYGITEIKLCTFNFVTTDIFLFFPEFIE